MERPQEKPPIILTTTDALMYAADNLARMAADAEMVAVILGVFDKPDRDKPMPADLTEKLAELRSIMPDPALHIASCRSAAKSIRDLAIEERLVAARAQTDSFMERQRT